MKKRILSAVLALAMALTLLPVSVFAAGDYDNPDVSDLDGDGTETVKFVAQRDKDHPDRGWYATHTYEVTENGKTTKKSKDVFLGADPSGLSVGGKYYEDAADIYDKDKDGNKTRLKGAVIVIGGTVTIDAVNATSLTLDVYGGEATISASGGKLTSVTVRNSSYATQGKGEVKLDSGLLDTLSSVDLSHVTWSDSACALEWKDANDKGVKHSVKLNDVDASTVDVTLTGVGTDTNKTQVGQTFELSNSSVKSVTVTGNSSTVKLNQVLGTAPAVSMTGTGGSFTFTGGGSVAGLTVTGSTTGDKNGNDLTAAPASISIAAGCTVASINNAGVTGEKAGGKSTVNISGNVTGATNLRNAAVTVSGGNIGNLTVETGSVKVSGSNATVGTVALAHDATFNIEGKEHTIKDLKVDGANKNAATVTFTVPAEPSNTLGTAAASITDYNKKTISGGTWKSAVPAANLADAVKYQFQSAGTGGEYTYYTADQLADAVLKQGSTSGSTLTMKDYPATGTGDKTVTFANGAMTWGVLTVPATGAIIPKLPTQMNGVATPYWTDGTFTNLSGKYPTEAGQATELNAGGGGAVTGKVTKLTDVQVGGTTADITATLVGNVITLSGAVEASDTTFTLTLETDAVKSDGNTTPKDVPVTIDVDVIREGKNLSFVHKGSQDLGYGVILENDFATIKLGNGTKYTLNGQGLNEPSLSIGVSTEAHPNGSSTYPADEGELYLKNAIEVVVSDSKYSGTQTLKNIVIAVINGDDAAVDWSDSPAVKRAINAVLATFKDSDVEGFFKSARQKAWSDNGIKGQSYKTDGTCPTAYDEGVVWLAPYLEVNVSDYKPSTSAAGNGTMTATLTLKWRVEVHPESGSTEAMVNDANNLAKNGVYIAKSGTLSFSGDLAEAGGTGVAITFDAGVEGAEYAHQGSVYDYAIATNAFTVTHAGTGGNLGTFVFDAKTPLISLGGKPTAPAITPTGDNKYYSTLQAAVDDAEDGEYILVDSAYGGSLNITMTGKARTIYIQANGKNVVVANASGGLVDPTKTGSLYTIKLNRDNTVAVAVADIAVAGAANGSVSADVSKANEGATVTLTVKPNTGYKLSKISAVTDGNVSVAVSATGTVNQYSLVVPKGAKKVTVTPSFVLADNKASISVNSNSSGTASVYTGTTDGRVEQGGTAIITMQPKAGYRTMDVTLRADNGKTVYSSRQDKNSWSITVPSGATLVTVTPSFDLDNGTPFVDVKSTDWASPYVSWMYQKDYTTGKDTQYTFKPTDNVTRQEIVAFLWKANGSPSMKNSSYKNPFIDVYTSDWAYDAIVWAAANGLVDTSSRTFGKTVNASRAEVVTILYKYAGSPAASTKTGFIDVPTNAAYAKAVSWAEQQGITNGKDNRNTFKPNIAITRQEVSKMIYVAQNPTK